MGCHAGDVESYTLFADLFNPVIKEWKFKSLGHVKSCVNLLTWLLIEQPIRSQLAC